MGELIEGLVEAIGAFFNNYFSSLDNIMMLAQASPDSVIEGFPSQALWRTACDISDVVGVGVASVIISLFLFFELAAIFNRADTKGWDGIYWILMAFLKVVVAITIARNMSLIIQMCFQITSKLVLDLQNSNLLQSQEIQNIELSQKLMEFYEHGSFWDKIGGYIVGCLCNLVNSVAMVIVEIICKIRFIEIYVFTAVAPLPFCTFCNQEYKNIGIAFIKRLIALGLQGVFISFICVFYVQIVNTSIGNVLETAGSNPSGAMASMMGYSILLVIAIFQTGGWSKSLLQIN